MDRYGKYFLQHILWLDDGFNEYYVQDPFWGYQEILDEESMLFDWPEETEQWLIQCAKYEDYITMRRLRVFLSNDCAEPYNLHRMNTRQVLRAAARQITHGFYQIVIKPKFEPLKRQPKIIDVICDIQNSELPPIEKGKEPGEIYQIRHVGNYTYDENIALNILKLLPNTANNIWNIGVDTVNVVLHDAQYISKKGGKEYLKARLNTELNWSKEAAEALSNLVKDGPRQVMNFLTDPDMDAVKDFFKSVLYAKNWEAALAIGLAIGLEKKLNPRVGSSVKTSGARSGKGGVGKLTNSNKKVVKSKPAPPNELKPVEIRTAKQESAALEKELGELRTGPKTTDEPGKTSSTTDGLASGTSGVPMDPAKFERIKKSIESKGGVIDQSDDAEAYLKMRGAEGLTLNEKTILLPKGANTSAVYEELIHSAQFRKGIATSSNVNEMEIQAAEKLIKNRKAYKIPNSETRQTIERLRQYRGQQ